MIITIIPIAIFTAIKFSKEEVVKQLEIIKTFIIKLIKSIIPKFIILKHVCLIIIEIQSMFINSFIIIINLIHPSSLTKAILLQFNY